MSIQSINTNEQNNNLKRANKEFQIKTSRQIAATTQNSIDYQVEESKAFLNIP